MDAQKKMLKDEINFLEYSNWTISRKNNKISWTLDKPHGKYEMLSALGLPSHFDKIVLYFLLYKLYYEKKLNSYGIKTTRYEMAKNIFGGTHFGKNIYDRIMMSLKKWKAIAINFYGVFYEGETYSTRFFAMIDSVCLHEKSGELTIRFNEDYINQLKESKFYKLIDFEQYKKLHKAISARMYEILIKSFERDDEWAINIQALAEKVTFEKRDGFKKYQPSDIVRQLKAGINEINKKTDLHIAFDYNRASNTCVFRKLKKQKETFVPAKKIVEAKKKAPSLAEQMATCMETFNGLPAEEQKKIRAEIKKQQFFKFMPDETARIFTYMTMNKR